MKKSFSDTGKIDISAYGIKVNGIDIAKQITKAIGYKEEGSPYCAPLYGKITVTIDTVGTAPFGEEASRTAYAEREV